MFKVKRERLLALCIRLRGEVEACIEQEFLSPSGAEVIAQVEEKLQSHRFSVAVVGEFSKGKSTLLNALLGEEVQPVRDIPCSGAISVLQHGDRKRVICRYRDSSEEEIPIEQYHERATIPEAVAVGEEGKSISGELGGSQIEELIFEHPNLELCKNGVIIIDSPGLNEHPNRTEITEKIVERSDAVIFMTSAQNLLTMTEQQELKLLKRQLNHNLSLAVDQAANNLFVLVNFCDMVQNLQPLKRRAENILLNSQSQLVSAKDKIHFISARESLQSVLSNQSSQYYDDFQAFVGKLTSFLLPENREQGVIGDATTRLNNLITHATQVELQNAEEILDGTRHITDSQKRQILERISEAGARSVRVEELADQLLDRVIDEVDCAWEEWLEAFSSKVEKRSQNWETEYSLFWDKDKVFTDYGNQFRADLQEELFNWANGKVVGGILDPRLRRLDTAILRELEQLQQSCAALDRSIDGNFSQELDFKFQDLDIDLVSGKVFSGVAAGGLLAAGLYSFTLIALGPIAVAGIVAGLVASLGMSLFGHEGAREQAKRKVVEAGIAQFENISGNICDNLVELLRNAFSERLEKFNALTKDLISRLQTQLAQQEKLLAESAAERQAQKEFIKQKRKNLSLLQQELDLVVSSQ
ncbi:MAG: hypothetical protein HC838_00885 [Spirulinaceae cyanobacterium RM2_2_10]|nr:hypothetical protein [Spirulinaceae cyanobacterium RM2_2_10]